jgi:cinnamoyl-CoA reductase
MMAEKTAMEEAATRGLELAVVVPHVTIGPALQRTLNESINGVLKYITGAKATYPNAVAGYTDVRDVARAHLLVYECPDARGRYLCIGEILHRAQFIHMLRGLLPDHYPVTTKYGDDGKPMVKPYNVSNQRLKDLGLEFTPVRESLFQTVVSLLHKGHLLLPATGPILARL